MTLEEFDAEKQLGFRANVAAMLASQMSSPFAADDVEILALSAGSVVVAFVVRLGPQLAEVAQGKGAMPADMLLGALAACLDAATAEGFGEGFGQMKVALPRSLVLFVFVFVRTARMFCICDIVY